jgi:hypothetical protein
MVVMFIDMVGIGSESSMLFIQRNHPPNFDGAIVPCCGKHVFQPRTWIPGDAINIVYAMCLRITSNEFRLENDATCFRFL